MTIDTKAGSITNVDAGRRMRLSRSRLADADAAGLERRGAAYAVAAAVWCLTASYTKAWDRVYLDTLMEMTGLDQRHLRAAIKQLVALGVIQWIPSYSRGPNGGSLIGLPSGAAESPSADTARSDRADTARLPGKPGSSPPATQPSDAMSGEEQIVEPDPKPTHACRKHPAINWLVRGDKCPECERARYLRERGHS